MIGQCQAAYRRHSANMSLCYTDAIPEMRHRQAAVEWFLSASRDRIEDAEGVRTRAFRALAIEAVGHGHRSFDDGDLRTSREFTDYALELSPDIRRSSTWLKLSAKRVLGPRMSGMIRTALQKR
jgi:hypothetical protein